MDKPFKETTVKKLTELEINKMSEKQLQEQYIKYLQQRLLKIFYILFYHLRNPLAFIFTHFFLFLLFF